MCRIGTVGGGEPRLTVSQSTRKHGTHRRALMARHAALQPGERGRTRYQIGLIRHWRPVINTVPRFEDILIPTAREQQPCRAPVSIARSRLRIEGNSNRTRFGAARRFGAIQVAGRCECFRSRDRGGATHRYV